MELVGATVGSGPALLALAAGVVGLASVYRGRLPAGETVRRKGRAFLFAAALGVFGFLGVVVASLVLQGALRAVVGPLPTLTRTAVLQAGVGIGTVGAVLYARGITDFESGFVDDDRPSRRDLGYGLAGLVVLFATFGGVTLVMNALGVEPAAHGTAGLFAETTAPLALTAVFVVTSLLVVGPAEELLYRNVVQKSLYGEFSRRAAVVLASVVFAAMHFSAYSTGTPIQVAFSLGIVFALSLTLGAVYERTENVLVPGVVHGLFNVSQFVLIAASRTDLLAV